jgi:hypothetical protein
MKATILEIAGALVLAACGEVRGDGDGQPTDASTTDADDDDASTDESAETSTSATETTEGESSAEDGAADSSTGAPTSTCVGWALDGHVADVHAREGAEVEAACDPTPTACGGDPTGSWTVLASCGHAPVDIFDCESATESDYVSTMTGTRAFAADGGFTWDLVITETLSVELDTASCYGMDCTAFAASLQTETSTATCESLDEITCACAIEYTSPLALDGTWSTNDDTLVIDLNGPVVELPFCASEDRLALWTPRETATTTDVPCTDVDDCTAELGDAYAHYDCVEPTDVPPGD